MAQPMLFSGARGKIVADGVALAFVTDISVSVTNNVRVPHTFGSPAGRSTEPLSTSCSGSFGHVIPVNDANGNPVDASAIALGLEPLLVDLFTSSDFTIDILDKVTNQTIASIRNCRLNGRSLNLSAGSLAQGRMGFTGIYDGVSGNAPDRLGF